MLSFKELFAKASARKGGEKALEALLPVPESSASLAKLDQSRYLSAMTRAVFQAGFVWKVVEAKWPDFESAFLEFDPKAVVGMSPDALEALGSDPRVIRNWTKIKTVPHNARMILDIAAEHGSVGQFIAQWPTEDIVGLWQFFKRRGSRLGGNSGPFFLRFMGKDTFLPTGDVILALQNQKIIGKNIHTKRDLNAAQEAFNGWRCESGRPLCQISRILACTVGKVGPPH